MGGGQYRDRVMHRLYWWLTDLLAKSLTAEERTAVCGDIAERGASGAEAMQDLLGLVARRQARLWRHWRAWVSLFVVVIPFALVLNVVSRQISDGTAIPIWMYVNNWTSNYLSNSAFRNEFAYHFLLILTHYMMLTCWSWTVGLVLGSLSRAVTPVNGTLFVLVLLIAEVLRGPGFRVPGGDGGFSTIFYGSMFPAIVQIVFVFLPAIRGMLRGVEMSALPLAARTIVWVAATAAMTALISQDAIRGPFQIMRLQLVLAVTAPVAYLLSAAMRRRPLSNLAAS